MLVWVLSVCTHRNCNTTKEKAQLTTRGGRTSNFKKSQSWTFLTDMFESYENMIRQQLFDTFWKSNVDAWGSRSKWVRCHLNKVNHNSSLAIGYYSIITIDSTCQWACWPATRLGCSADRPPTVAGCARPRWGAGHDASSCSGSTRVCTSSFL